MEITEDRMKHSLAVAAKMRSIAAASPEKYNVSPNDAYILSFLHDVGYAFVERQEDHAEAGGLALHRQGYRYWREVYYHGKCQSEYSSPMLWLLNYADMTTGPAAESMTMQERLADIAERYGESSQQAAEAERLCEMIEKEQEKK